MLRFRLFGIPTEIQLSFWFVAVVLGWSRLDGPAQYLIVEWVFVVLISVLIHELGHAFAMMRYGLRPEIMLYMMGGMTMTQGMNRLSRGQRIFISFAGPLAGFIFGAVALAVTYAAPGLTQASLKSGPAALTIAYGLDDLMWVNFGWGLINLIPVLPLDGGHILEDGMGPKRARTTAMISIGVGAVIALWALSRGAMWIGFIFGLAAFHSYQRLRAAADTGRPKAAPKPVDTEPPIPAEMVTALAKAKKALLDDRFDEAGTLAELVLSNSPPKSARMQALEVIAWAHLLEGRPDEAARAIKAVQRDGEPDMALVGAVLQAKGELDKAREVLEAARSQGDDRKEVVGPLIQILIEKGEVARAAAIALDIIDTLSDEDARQMASIAFDREAWGWSARLSEAVFARTESPDDAYDAARSRSLEGDFAAALALLRRAVAAGFSDAARVWSDKALEKLRNDESSIELESLLPRP